MTSARANGHGHMEMIGRVMSSVRAASALSISLDEILSRIRRAESLLPGPLTQVVHMVHHPQIEVGGGPAGEALQDPRLLNHLHHRPVERVMPVPNGLGLRHLVAGLHTHEVAVNGDMLEEPVVSR